MPRVNSAQPTRAQAAQAEARAVLRDDLSRLLQTDWGRRVMSRVLREAMLDTPVFNQNAMAMSSLAGKQELGLWLDSLLREADMANYLKMTAERYA